MAVPLPYRLHPSQSLITLDVAAIGLTSVANEDHVSFLGQFTAIADPVQHFLVGGVILEGLFLHLMGLSVVNILDERGAAVRSSRGAVHPPLEAG